MIILLFPHGCLFYFYLRYTSSFMTFPAAINQVFPQPNLEVFSKVFVDTLDFVFGFPDLFLGCFESEFQVRIGKYIIEVLFLSSTYKFNRLVKHDDAMLVYFVSLVFWQVSWLMLNAIIEPGFSLNPLNLVYNL